MNKTQQDNPDLYDANVIQTQPLPAPTELIEEFPVSKELSNFITTGRNELHNILAGEDDRFVIITGPCSIHDTDAGLDYAKKLKPLVDKYKEVKFIRFPISTGISPVSPLEDKYKIVVSSIL